MQVNSNYQVFISGTNKTKQNKQDFGVFNCLGDY